MVVSNQIFAKQKGHIKILPEETQAKMSKTARYFIVWKDNRSSLKSRRSEAFCKAYLTTTKSRPKMNMFGRPKCLKNLQNCTGCTKKF